MKPGAFIAGFLAGFITAVLMVIVFQARSADAAGLPADPISVGDRGQDVRQVQYVLASHGYVLDVDGIYGVATAKAVMHWQRANALRVDGIVGPVTWDRLVGGALAAAPAVRVEPPPPGNDGPRSALAAEGATDSETAFALMVCQRESRCTLDAVNQNARTEDDSWGPWQINFYGSLRPGRIALLGPPSRNTATWRSAAHNFLTLLRSGGRCHWIAPNYCSGGGR